MLPKFVKRRVRLMSLVGVAGAAWSNRQDVRRWYGFVRRAATARGDRSWGELVDEARVRAKVTADPVLRHDPAIDDLRMSDGIVTLLTHDPGWPDAQRRIAALKRLRGVRDVDVLHVDDHAPAAAVPDPDGAVGLAVAGE